MKKVLIAMITFVIIFCCFIPVHCEAPTEIPEITYGLRIVKNKVKLQKNAVKGTSITFNKNDFSAAFGIDDYSYIKITELPELSDGVLKMGGIDILKGQMISKENIGYLKFVPFDTNTDCASFEFSDDSGYWTRCLECSINYTDDVNSSPKASDISIMTYKNISVFGKLTAEEPDEDMICYNVTAAPKKGILNMSEDGSFIYRPISTYTGKDKFEYIVYDEFGNCSEVKEVTLNVLKSYNDLYFSDMTDHWAHVSAITMVKSNIMDVVISDKGLPVFIPEKKVTRGDFLIMAMKAAGADKNLKDVDNTGYSDDQSIPYYMKKYVYSAKSRGIITGIETESGMVFDAAAPITRAQAAVIINRLLDLPTAGTIEVFADGKTIPAWAENAMKSLSAFGIMTGYENGTLDPYGILDNAQCAQVLANVINRNKDIK